MDFGINASIYDLTLEQMNELRIMTFVAIGEAHSMWSRAMQENNPPSSSSTPKILED